MNKKLILSFGIGVIIGLLLAWSYVTLEQKLQPVARENTKENFPSWEKVNQFTYGGWDFKLLGETGETATMGVDTELIPNLTNLAGKPDPNSSKVTYEWFYDDGLSITFTKGIESDKVLISSLSVTNNKYKMKWGLDIGSSAEKIKEILGEPYRKDILTSESDRKAIPSKLRASYDESWTYYYIEGAFSSVTFHIKDNIIMQIDWGFYTG